MEEGEVLVVFESFLALVERYQVILRESFELPF